MTNGTEEIGNPGAERNVLQGLLENWERKTEYDITEFDFNDPHYLMIYKLLEKYDGKESLVDGEFKKIGDCIEKETWEDVKNWFHYYIVNDFEESLELVKKASKQKKQGLIARRLHALIVGGGTQDEILKLANEIYETETIKKQDSESIKQEIVNDALHLGGEIKRYLTNYKKIDDITGGWYPGQLITIAARTGVGKTMIALNFIANQLQTGNKCMFFSLEMGAKEIYQRLYARFGQLSVSKIKGYYELNDQEIEKLNKGIDTLDKYEEQLTIIDDKYGIGEIVGEIRKAYNKGMVDIVYIDYVGLIEAKGENRNNQVANITRELKKLTQTLNIPIVILAQLNRKVEDRYGGGDEPKLSDLRDSGAIEQDSNVVLMLEKVDDDCIKVHIRKNRNGPTGTTYQRLVGQYMTIGELTEQEEQLYKQQN